MKTRNEVFLTNFLTGLAMGTLFDLSECSLAQRFAYKQAKLSKNSGMKWCKSLADLPKM